MLGRLGGPTAGPQLRRAVRDALDYEREIERRRERGEPESMLCEHCGLGICDLRETLEQALGDASAARR